MGDNNYISEPIAIIGRSCRYPGPATSPSKLWAFLQNPYDVAKKAPSERFNIEGFYHPNGEYHGTTDAPKAYWLEEDAFTFDTSFFNYSPREAETIDPAGKILLEVVYEGMESAGLTVQQCAGSKIGVFVGLMTADYELLTAKDEISTSQYCVTGTSRAILSNRVSYFFNWTGPSMTIDTACSSSLVAMHQAVLSLRSGESNMACVAGVNVMLSPDAFTIESNLHMLSPDGHSKMWDESANGYARGEGAGVFFLKPLSKALADGDNIECIIRETGVNSDGRTRGITMPNPLAQAALIKDTYARSGLDASNSRHMCQYFEAHGTGTQAGDPREAEAIHTAFFPPSLDVAHDERKRQLIVGSVKTAIGHTEGAAGVAGVLKALLGLQHGIIPPNLYFESPNPTVTPFLGNLKVPTYQIPWPVPSRGHPARASVNSFGFGGTNAHAIIERYEPAIHGQQKIFTHTPAVRLPLLLSANSDKTLARVVSNYIEYLQSTSDADIGALTGTHAFQRSAFPCKISVPATGRTELLQALEAKLAKSGDVGVRSKGDGSGRILAIFTGQGAQWSTMGKELIRASALFVSSLQECNDALRTCPDPPAWDIVTELSRPEESSRLGEAALSQPLCTALQIALSDLLSQSGVRLSGAVGHSSGEICAAYASGSLNKKDAMLVAYYRGFHAKLAGGTDGSKGGMMAVGMGVDDALDFCSQENLKSRLYVAASNAPASVTLSGDLETIQIGKAQLDEEKRFCRQLKVDTAYHSHHMDRCAGPYLESLAACQIHAEQPVTSCPWVSSVYGPSGKPTARELSGRYWRDNMVQPVLFAEALTRILDEHGPFDAVLEIGPHAALKGPASQVIQEAVGTTIPYSGVLSRYSNDVQAFSDALGMLWCHIGATAVDFKGYTAALGAPADQYPLAKDVPSYPWDHSQSLLRQPRLMKQYLHRSTAPHELLGIRTLDDTPTELRWRNVLRPSTIPWIKNHRFQSQIIIPAAAYCVMALDAGRAMASEKSMQATMVEINNLSISNGITMDDDTQGIETLLSLRYDEVNSTLNQLVASFSLDWGPVSGNRPTKRAVSGSISLFVREEDALPAPPTRKAGLRHVDVEDFYGQMSDIGLGYTMAFKSLLSLERRHFFAAGTLQKPHGEDTSILPVRPALLDSCFQVAFAAFAAPNDGALWTSFLPQTIRRMRFNVPLCDVVPDVTRKLDVEASVTSFFPGSSTDQANFSGDLDIFNHSGELEIQIEGLTVQGLATGSGVEDREFFLETVYKRDPWTGFNDVDRPDQPRVNVDLDTLHEHIAHLITSPLDSRRENIEDTLELALGTSPYRHHMELLKTCSRAMPALLPGLINEIKRESTDVSLVTDKLTQVVEDISHRHPHISVLEINLGGMLTLTESIHAGLAQSYSSFASAYTSAFVESVCEGQSTSDKHVSLQLDDDDILASLDEAKGPFDLVVISKNDDHILTSDVKAHVTRHLLKSGGFLVTIESNGRLLQDRLMGLLRSGRSSGFATPVKSLSGSEGSNSQIDQPLALFRSKHSGVSLSVEQSHNTVVDILRSPLSSLSDITISGSLLIIGGIREETRSLRHHLDSTFTSLGCEVTCVDFLSLVTPELLSGTKWVVLLADIDAPILQHPDAENLAGLQALFKPDMSLLWLTNGFYGGKNPHHSASVGLARTAKGETPKFRLQFLDVDTLVGIEELVAETLLRFTYPLEHVEDMIGISWTTEDEIVLSNGQILIPRIKPIGELNERLNSKRRAVSRLTSTEDAQVELTLGQQSGRHAYDIVAHDHARLQREQEKPYVAITVTHSSAWAVNLGEGLNLFFGVGNVAPERRVLFFSDTNSSRVSVPQSWTRDFDVTLHLSDAEICAQFFATILVSRMMVLVAGATMTLIEPPDVLISAITSLLEDEDVCFVTSDILRAQRDDRLIYIHPQLTKRAAAEILPTKSWILVDLENRPASNLRKLLDSEQSLDITKLLSSSASCREKGPAVDSAISLALQSSLHAHFDIKELTIKTPNALIGQDPQPKLTMVDWRKDSIVELKVQPLDLGKFLGGSKTYLLVGLTGELGESLCRLMAAHGARYFVVASRNPDKAEIWAQPLRKSGLTIHLVSLDVTDPVAVRQARKDVERMFPPIAGVIQGAMVLSDGLFADMTVESLQKALRPKVDGSCNLSDAFSEPTLDFFVMFSSLTCVGGNSGQSNYTAANLYMSGLAAQRRSKGLAASVLDIGVLYGIGYVNRIEGAEIYANLRRQGYLPISEQDVHEMFTEAVAASRPESGNLIQITTGLNRWNPAASTPLPWHNDARFSHHRAIDNADAVGQTVGGSSESIKGLLESSLDKASMVENLQKAFSAQLESMLHLAQGSLDPTVAIIDLGVDSLAAVEIRSWFLKEVGKDMPVLKVLGGASVANLCDEVATELLADRESAQEQANDVLLDSNSEPASDSTSDQSDLFDATDLSNSTDLSSEDEDEKASFEQVSSMSSSQARMWFPYQLLSDKTTYNCTTSYRLKGKLDVDRYEAALKAVIRKHQSLRTGFYTDQYSGDSMQAVATSSPFELKRVNNAREDVDSAKETEFIAKHVYDLEHQDVFIATLLNYNASHHEIIFGYHHIIMDGVSWQLLLQEVERFYINPPRVVRQPIDYLDFAVKQRADLESPAVQTKREFWKSSFADLPPPIPLFPFAKVSGRRPLDRYEATETFIELDQALVARIKAVSVDNKSTPFHFYLTTLQIMARKLLKIDDVCIGITDANRSEQAFMETIGLMLDSLPLRFKSESGSSEQFASSLQDTRTAVYSALGNSGVPLDVILDDIGVETSTSHLPLFQILVNYRMGAIKQKTLGPDVAFEYLAYEDARHPFDLILTIDEEDGRAGLTLSMQDYLYDKTSAHTFLKTFIHLLDTFSEAPDTHVSDCPVYPESLVKDALQLGKGPELTLDWPSTLTARIEQMAATYPNDMAIKDGNNVYTYAEMARRVDSIGKYLLDRGVRKGTRVGVASGPSADVVLSLLAILKIGAVYVPLDERNADGRLANMVHDASIHLIICNDTTKARIPAIVGASPETKSIKVSDIPLKEVTKLQDHSVAAETCFIMFTSGSTGKPKGVVLSNASFLTHIKAATKTMDLGKETVLQQSALGYDASLAQIFYALANGGSLVITNNRQESSNIADLMVREKVSLTLMAPSEYSVLFQYARNILDRCESWRIAMCGGEAFPSQMRTSFRELHLDNLEVWNAYGPTELSVASNMSRIDCSEANTIVPIGKAITGYNVCLVDDQVKPVPIGCSGQLAVSGQAVATGYLNNKLLTDEKFLPGIDSRLVKSTTQVSSRWYLTGDTARMDQEGRLIYMGRIENDAQIKLRGIRIELAEISNAILASTTGVISQAAASVRGDGDQQFLVAHVSFVPGNQPEDKDVYLNSVLTALPLPVYMRPAQLVPVDALPLTMSGKLDQSALSKLPISVGIQRPREGTAELNATEARLKEIWTRVLGRSGLQIDKSSSFFSVGGNSLLLLRLQAELKRSFAIDIKVAELFQINTLGDMARRIGNPHQSTNSNIQSPIDWKVETALPPSILKMPRRPSVAYQRSGLGNSLSVIVTGATGFLGSAIVRVLQDNPRIQEIHCLAIRSIHSPQARALQHNFSKVILYPGDLAQPRLGLGEDEARLLFADAAAVVHNGADVSFLKPYESLRDANVGSTSELVRLCLESHSVAALHFVSTAGVGAILAAEGGGSVPELKATSLSDHLPIAMDGYVSSKWASEVLLETAAEKTGLPVRIYRPSSITGPDAPALDIVHNVMNLSREMRTVPKMTGWSGWFDFISVERVAKEIMDGMMGSIRAGSFEFVHPTGEVVLPVSDAKMYLERDTGYEFREVEMDAWIKKAASYGMSELVAGFLSQIPEKGEMPVFPRLESTMVK